MAEIRKNNKPSDFYNLTYNFKDPKHAPTNFIRFKGPNSIFKGIDNDDIVSEDVKEEQKELKSDLSYIKQENPKNRSPDQAKTINNIENLCKSREEVLKLFNNHGKNMSKKIYKSKHGAGLKIITPKKKMLQRLPIALAQIKAGNNSESLLNEIRQIVYSLYQSKESTKKVYNNIIKSIKV